MLDNINNIDEITRNDLDQLIVDLTVSKDKAKDFEKAFYKLFDLTSRFVDNKSSSTSNDN